MQVPGILEKTTIRTKYSLMIYVSAFFFMFAYTILAFSIASFMISRLEGYSNPVFFVGVILGCSSFFAIFVDSFWAYLQKVHPPKKLTIWALIGLIITVAIFFLANFGSIEIFSPLRWIAFTFIAAFLYGWSFDLYDVTVATTIFSSSRKENLAQNISQKKVAEAIGMVVGLIIASVLSFFHPSLMQLVLIIILIAVAIFFKFNFDEVEDKSEKLEFSEHTLVDWKRVFRSIDNEQEVKEIAQEAPETVRLKTVSLAERTSNLVKNLPANALHLTTEILEKARLELVELLAKEGEIVKKSTKEPKVESKFNFKEMLSEVKNNFGDFLAIFSSSFTFPLAWSALLIMIFSFWDTMAITYQPLLLQEIGGDNEAFQRLKGVIMIIFIVPVFALQIPFSILADKIGRHVLMLLGLLTSGISVVILSTSSSITLIITMGILSGVGYAMAFSPAQAMFVSEFKRVFHLPENANSEKSAASLRVGLNVGNIIGQLLGGFLFSILGFSGGFMMFGFFFLLVSIVSIFLFFKIRPQKEVQKDYTADELALQAV